MQRRQALVRLLGKYAVITVGCALYALAFCWFFENNAISAGGFGGIAQILHRLVPAIPIGVATIVLNIPLFILGFRRQGPKLLISSGYAILVSNLLIDLISSLYQFTPSSDPLMASIYGGVLTGVALGLLLNAGATTGGTELAARMLKYRFRHLPIGKLCLVIDVTIILLYALVFRNINNALYGIIAMYIFSIAMDAVVYGMNRGKMAYIVSDHYEEIRKSLLDMDLGITMLKAEGGWKRDDKRIILCAFKNNQIASIKATITAIDPDAFIILCETHEVLGEGFGAYSDDSL